VTAALKLDLSARAFAVVLLATVIALGGAGWFASVAPKHSKASKLATAIQADQARLATAEREQHALTSAAKAKEADLGALQVALPDALAMPQIVDQLDALAARAGVTLDTVTPSAAVLGVGYEAVPISVVVDGRFFAVESFLRLVRNQVQLGKEAVHARGRLLDVQSVQLDQTEPAPSVTATISMQAFYFSAHATPPSTAASTDTTQTTTTPTG
jgi:Tfp pilus assembly protein PilO